MRSKWLEWTPEMGFMGFESSVSEDFSIPRTPGEIRTQSPVPSRNQIFDKTDACEPSKPTKPLHTALSKPALETQWYFWDRHDDPYGRRAQVAIDVICATQAPQGLIVWLDEHSPSLYERLTRDLPDEISHAWNARIPLEGFDALCSAWVDTFHRAAKLYRDSKRTPNLFEQREFTEGECGP